MKIIVLGGGLVGLPLALDLSEDKDFEITVIDRDKSRCKKIAEHGMVQTKCLELSNSKSIQDAVSGFDLVINALPGCSGYSVLKAVIEAGKDVVDISFFPEDPFSLNELAIDNGVTAVVDCGVAPGLSNMLVGKAASSLEKVEEVMIMVGGLPQERVWPFEYKAVFSPADVIEEYMRHARVVDNGAFLEKRALSETELVDFRGVGTLEAFNSDGLRTLLRTIKANRMYEKTLRYPGHAEKISLLRDAGFFSKEAVEVNGSLVVPLELTSKVLFNSWKLGDNDKDITIMKVTVTGSKGGELVEYVYELIDRYDEKKKVHSMARTTGYTATSVARLLAKGLFDRKGVIPPEYIGMDEKCFEFVTKSLAERNISFTCNVM